MCHTDHMTTLRQYRADTGTTLQAIADACNTSRGYIHQIESGQRTPGLRLAVRISAATGGKVSVEALLDPQVPAE